MIGKRFLFLTALAVIVPSMAMAASLSMIPPVGNNTACDALAMTPDGKYVVGTASGGTAAGYIWDAVNGARTILDTANASPVSATGIAYSVNEGIQQIHVLGMSAGYPTVFHSTDQTATWTKWRDTATYTTHNVGSMNMMSSGMGADADKYYFGLNKNDKRYVYTGVGVGTATPTITAKSTSNVDIVVQGMGGTGGGTNGRAAGYRKDTSGNRLAMRLQQGTQGYIDTLDVVLANRGEAWDVSDDGNVFVGFGPTNDGGDTSNRPFVNFFGTADLAYPLPLLPDCTNAATKGWAYGTNADGKYVVGMLYRELTPGVYTERAVLWSLPNPADPNTWSVLDLTDFATSAGILDGFSRLSRARSVGVDENGNVYVSGLGYAAGTGASRGFVLMVPEPATLGLLLLGLPLLRGRR